MKVDHITSHEQQVRLDIYEGRLHPDEASAELLSLEKRGRAADAKRHQDDQDYAWGEIKRLRTILRQEGFGHLVMPPTA